MGDACRGPGINTDEANDNESGIEVGGAPRHTPRRAS
jgi:hypothetical protein